MRPALESMPKWTFVGYNFTDKWDQSLSVMTTSEKRGADTMLKKQNFKCIRICLKKDSQEAQCHCDKRALLPSSSKAHFAHFSFQITPINSRRSVCRISK